MKLTRRFWVDNRGHKRSLITRKRQVINWQRVGRGKKDYTGGIVFVVSLIIGIGFFVIAFLNHAADSLTPVTDRDMDKQDDNPEDYNDGPFSFQGPLEGGATGTNETKDANPRVKFWEMEGEGPSSIEYVRGYPEISTVDYIVFGLVMFMLPSGIHGKIIEGRKDRIEQKFPDFLRDLAEFWKGGLSMTVAVETLSKGEYGHLNDEVNKMATQISWGISFEEVLTMLTERVDSQVVKQSISMVKEANKAGGRISDILLAASYDAKEIKALQTERAMNVGSYVAVIYTSFGVYLIIIIILVYTFVPAIADSSIQTAAAAEQSGTAGSGGFGGMQVKEMDPIWIATIFFWSIVVQAMGGGMVAGFMRTGKLYGGFLQGTMLLLASWGLYELLGIQTSMLTYRGTNT